MNSAGWGAAHLSPSRQPRALWATALLASLLGWTIGAWSARPRQGLDVPEQGLSITVMEGDADRAIRYRRQGRRMRVKLPDGSRAALALNPGAVPRALLFPSSNQIASTRQRALQAGAVMEPDQSLLLPLLTDGGTVYELRLRADGDAVLAPVPQQATFSAGSADSRSSNAGR